MARPRANTAGEWMRRWWWVLLLAGLALLIVLVELSVRLQGKRADDVVSARARLEAAREETEAKLEELSAEMSARRDELDRIEAIPNERERLEKLAEFANRPRERGRP